MMDLHREQAPQRILGRQLGRELSHEEIALIAGGEDMEGAKCSCGTDSTPHFGTCTNENDCD